MRTESNGLCWTVGVGDSFIATLNDSTQITV